MKIRNGVVSTGRLTFHVPGALANLQGTYALHGGAVHLTGTMKMDADISHAATGFKSALLKPLDPFFKRKKAGAARLDFEVIGARYPMQLLPALAAVSSVQQCGDRVFSHPLQK